MFLIYPKDYFGSRYAENVFANTFIYKNNSEQAEWDKYYMIDEFDEIKELIPNISKKYTVRIGVVPEILQYNGLKTIEGYYSLYPIERLNVVRQIDFNERKKVLNYYTNSNRNYLFVNDTKSGKPDWDLLKKEDVKYLIADRDIKGFKPEDLLFSKNLRVYEINSQ